MAIYIDGSKYDLMLNGTPHFFNVGDMYPKLKGVVLLSSESYILKDSKGLYLTAKESD